MFNSGLRTVKYWDMVFWIPSGNQTWQGEIPCEWRFIDAKIISEWWINTASHVWLPDGYIYIHITIYNYIVHILYNDYNDSPSKFGISCFLFRQTQLKIYGFSMSAIFCERMKKLSAVWTHHIYIYMYMYCICCISSMTYMDLSKNGVPLVVHCAPHFPCPLSTKIARAWGKIPWFSQRKWAAQRRRRSWGSLRVPSFGIDSYPPEQSSTGWALLKNWGVLKSWGIPKSSPWLFQY